MRIYSALVIVVSLCLFILLPKSVEAATLINVKDTISTSRPSPSTSINGGFSSGVSTVTVIDNKSRFLASDSARLINNQSGAFLQNITVASQSSDLTTLYFTANTSNALNSTSVIAAPITAMHVIQFTTVNTIPASGNILITFPGASNTTASPSATTFAFNGITSTQLASNNANTCTWTVSAPTIECETNSSIAAGTTVTLLIGCTAQSGGTCTTQAPRLINPTKSATAGTADVWKVNIVTRNASDVALDDATVSIGTIDSVQVRATVDPTLTFTIAGVANGSAVNTGNTTGCTANETTNTGIAATATLINLGVVSNTPTAIDTKLGNIAAQLITVSTNAGGGYTLTATSAGQLRNYSNGFAFDSDTTPAAFPNGLHYFGLNACGLDVNTGTWGNANCESEITGSSNACNYGWPTQTTAVTLASDSTGPVGNAVVAGNGLTTVRYAAGTDATVPAGEYQTAVTYVATATF